MKYIKKTLDNGMHVILVPIKRTKIITIGFFIGAGSRNENEDNSGIAHFLEHMMFKGTKNRTAETLFKELDTLGAIYNATTTTHHTYYYIYGNSDDIKHLLDIILDIYINAHFETKEINLERKVIIEEMRMRSDTPLMKLYSIMHKKIFNGTSLARDIIGTTDTVMSFKRSDFIDFRKTCYRPNNTVFVISGNFSPDPIFKIVNRALEPLVNPKNKEPTYFSEKKIIFKNMDDQKEPYVYVKKNNFMQQVYVILAFPMYNTYKNNNQEIDLITLLLSWGFSSRLNKSLREKNGISYMSAAYPIVYSDAGIFAIQTIVNPSELMMAVKIILHELKLLKTELISKDEMKKIVNVSKNEVIYSLIKPMDILTYFGINFLFDDKFKPNINTQIEDLKFVKRHHIRDVASQIFVYDKINLFIYGNVSQQDYKFLDL